jgi:quercetin dioxygenase-like cupin family protein
MPSAHVVRIGQAGSVDFEWGRLTWFADQDHGATEQTLGLCELDPGQANPRHLHPNCEEVLHVLEGPIQHYTSETGWVDMNVGDTIVIPRDMPHQARNQGERPARMIISFSSPTRQTINVEHNDQAV